MSLRDVPGVLAALDRTALSAHELAVVTAAVWAARRVQAPSWRDHVACLDRSLALRGLG